MSDGQASEMQVEAETHEEAVEQVYAKLQHKNLEKQMMSEKIVIFSKGGMVVKEIDNILCSTQN
jgi:hypothetical protein